MKFLWQQTAMREGEGTTGGGETQQQTQSKPWYDGKADAETIGHWQNRGWIGKSPEEIAIEATKSHREAERVIGVPADQILRLPKDANDEAGWKGVWQRLGAPKEASEYDFAEVKNAAGEAPPQALLDTIRATAAASNMPKAAAQRMAQDVVKYMDSQSAASAASYTDTIEAQKNELKQNWGQNYEANKFVAQQAAQKFGMKPEEVDALEKTIGYARTMNFLRDVGMRIGEGRFVAGGEGNGNGGLMTVEQATARKAELMNDKDWAKRYLDGGVAEAREMAAITRIMVGTG